MVASSTHSVDKPTHQCGKVQTKVRYGKPGQDKARVRESRYVIKVMSVNMKGETFLWSARTKGCTGPFNWAIIN